MRFMPFQNFKTLPLTFISVSVLTLSVLTGCSNGLNMGSSNKNSVVSSADKFDSYYGSPNTRQRHAAYKPKITRTVTKPVFKYNAPKRYVVKKGDTLWAISNMFLNNPSYWPEIWDKNQKVANPHRIYPGDVLYIYQGGRRKIKTSSGSVVEKMVPQMRIERLGGGKPISTLAPLLVWPEVVDNETLHKAPYIVSARDAKILLEKDMTVYVKNLADRHAGGRYAIMHKGDKLVDPETGQQFGYEVTYNGFLEVDRPALGADVATATVAESKREIRRGDRLLYIEDETHALDSDIIVPNHKVRGSIISLFDAKMITGQTQVVVINKGARNGIKVGYTLGIYSPGETVVDKYHSEHLVVTKKAKDYFKKAPVVTVDIPPARSATAIVYKVLNDISYAVITESDHEVKNGYKIGNP